MALEAGQVADTAGNLASAQTLGTFSVALPSTGYTVFLPLVQGAGVPDTAATMRINPALPTPGVSSTGGL